MRSSSPVWMLTNLQTKLILSSVKIASKLDLYIRNLKQLHLTPVFRLHNINLELSICSHKFKWLLYIETPVLDFWCANMNNNQICWEKKTINTYLKAKNSSNTKLISSLKGFFLFISFEFVDILRLNQLERNRMVLFYF